MKSKLGLKLLNYLLFINAENCLSIGRLPIDIGELFEGMHAEPQLFQKRPRPVLTTSITLIQIHVHNSNTQLNSSTNSNMFGNVPTNVQSEYDAESDMVYENMSNDEDYQPSDEESLVIAPRKHRRTGNI